MSLIKSKYISEKIAERYLNCNYGLYENKKEFCEELLESIKLEPQSKKSLCETMSIILFGVFYGIKNFYYKDKSKKEIKNIFVKQLSKNNTKAKNRHKTFPIDEEALYFLFLEEVLEYTKAVNDKEGEEREIAELIDIATLCVRCIDNIKGVE